MRYGLIVLGILLLSGHALAGDPAAVANWPQFRGPLASGVAPQGDPPTKWGESKNVRWKSAHASHACASAKLESRVMARSSISIARTLSSRVHRW